MIPPQLLAKLTGWLQPALIVALVALSAWCFWQGHRLDRERQAHRATTALYQAREAAALAAARDRENALRQQVDTARAERDAAHEEIARGNALNTRLLADVARLRADAADADRLRDQLAAYAAGGAGDTTAACQARSAALATYAAELSRAADDVAQSAGTVAGVAVAATGERDEFAADLAACVKAWPR